MGDTDSLLSQLLALDDGQLDSLIANLPDQALPSIMDLVSVSKSEATLPVSPLAQAQEIDSGYVVRDHLTYLSQRLAAAVRDVEQGTSRFLQVSMPPRMGKSQMCSIYLPLWLLRKHPDWGLGLISHSPTLAVGWGRAVRRLIEDPTRNLGLHIAPDAGAVSDWQTTQGGGIISRSAPGQTITGEGFKVLILDDPVKDFATAHSAKARDNLWDWWRANARSRLEPPSLVLVVGTRWHEDDMIGRLLSSDHEGDPEDWEQITFPAFAEESDVLGRDTGDPLLSPIIAQETLDQATDRWEDIRRSVGSYSWSALYQQRPSPAQGAIFNVGWWRYWTRDPAKVTEDGTVVLLPEGVDRGQGKWVDSWDAAFKDTKDSDYVVGQRWCRLGANRYLMDQQRGRWSFTATLPRMRAWSREDPGNPANRFVHRHLIEDKANGPAIIASLRHEIAGIIPINPTNSKEARARAVTPEVESHNVYLPHPSEPGYEWVAQNYLPEFREFPSGAHDDQVDATTQALSDLRDPGRSRATVPRSATQARPVRSIGRQPVTRSAATERRRTG